MTFTIPDDGVDEGEVGDSPDDNRTFVVAVLNTDPVALPWEYGPGGVVPTANIPLDSRKGCPPFTASAVTRDDGKYDYLCIVDITDMYSPVNLNPAPELPGGGTPPAIQALWDFANPAEWAARARFVRIPADVPVGWTYASPNPPPLNSGHDFSEVTVFQKGATPTVSTPKTTASIVGSGTLKSMAVRPDARYLYLIASDQGQENVAENAGLTDGGFHVPHLYVIDLQQDNLQDQAALNAAFTTPSSDFIRSYRFNKVVTAGCDPDPNVCPDPICLVEPTFEGFTAINSTIPGFPTTTWPAGIGADSLSVMKGTQVISALGLTHVNGIPAADVGSYHPGEHQSDPTARTRLQIVENEDLVGPWKTRMYLGTTGIAQDNLFLNPRMGNLLSIGLSDNDGSPEYLATLTLDQNVNPSNGAPSAADHWAIGGLDFLAPRKDTGDPDRNILVVIATHARLPNATVSPQDRLFLVEDR